jgi:hypothetical protein
MNRHIRAIWWRLLDCPLVEPLIVGLVSTSLGVAAVLYLTGV